MVVVMGGYWDAIELAQRSINVLLVDLMGYFFIDMHILLQHKKLKKVTMNF